MAFDLSLPPIPPNGFPDEDEDPIILSDDMQSVQGSVEVSIPQRNESKAHTSERANEQRPLHERLSTTRNDGCSTAYERAAAKYDFKERFQANEYVSIPGKPLFLPRNRRFSWDEVRYAENPCISCTRINESRPKEAPLLPCLASTRFDRCVFCVCTNPSGFCSVGNELRASKDVSRMQYPQTAHPYMQQWQSQLWENDSPYADSSYAGHSYRAAYDRASSSYNNSTRRSSEYDRGDIRYYDSVDSRKRKRRSSSRDTTSVSIQPSNIQPSTIQPSIIQPSTKTTAIDRQTNHVTDSAAVDALFPNVNNEVIETINSDADTTLDEAHAQSHVKDNSKARGSFSTVASTPPLDLSNEDEISCMLNQIDGWTRGKEELKDKIHQFQEKYSRKESETEKLEKENERLSQSADKWKDLYKKEKLKNEELEEQIKTIQSRNGSEKLEKLKNDVRAAFDQYELA